MATLKGYQASHDAVRQSSRKSRPALSNARDIDSLRREKCAIGRAREYRHPQATSRPAVVEVSSRLRNGALSRANRRAGRFCQFNDWRAHSTNARSLVAPRATCFSLRKFCRELRGERQSVERRGEPMRRLHFLVQPFNVSKTMPQPCPSGQSLSSRQSVQSTGASQVKQQKAREGGVLRQRCRPSTPSLATQ